MNPISGKEIKKYRLTLCHTAKQNNARFLLSSLSFLFYSYFILGEGRKTLLSFQIETFF